MILLHKYTVVHGSKILTLIDKELTVVIKQSHISFVVIEQEISYLITVHDTMEERAKKTIITPILDSSHLCLAPKEKPLKIIVFQHA